MRFTSVGPKWRAALQSSLLSLSLPSPSCPLGYHPLLPSYRVRSLDRPSVRLSLSLFFSRSLGALAARRRLQECTKCTALTDTRPRSTASTCLLRPFASPCPFSLPLSLSSSLLRGPSFLFSPVGYSASAGHSRILYIVLPPPPPLPLPGTDRFSTTGVVARLFSSTPSRYVRSSTHARTHTRADRYAEEARCVVVVGDTYRVVHRDAFSLRAFSRPPAALSLSLFPA